MIGRLAAGLLALSFATSLAAQAPKPPGANPNPLDSNEEGQPPKLPALPAGMTLQQITDGDALFHGKGACFACHGPEAAGMPNAGSGLTTGLNFVPFEWHAIDSLITAGIPETITRTAVQMPPRGGKSNLTDDEISAVAAYVWAISQTRGEPWEGGHTRH